ncbi:MAG: hypothetical protein K2O93_07490 [Oscillospiraceae bacterium]|jgi:hypothetical protein|uniref:hypothetical protein n=1 Tax=uncultured Oscillibacter sp. TaxID=876091 RepID=UPI0023C43E43|nr:hypothetical protein [uncultured Oscillibacter sp.]MDE7011041.1 hypothetical protein [Oscillospiraceae bacterium]
MKNLIRGLARYCTDLVLLGGAVAVAVGAGMICLPAGLIAGGVLAIAGAVLSSLGGGGER